MKTIRFISTFAMLAMATVVTAGSLYVTASAAAQQEVDSIAVAVQENIVPDENPLVNDVVVQEDPLSTLNAGPVVTSTPDQIVSDRSQSVLLDAEGGFSGHLVALRMPDGTTVPAASYTVKVLQGGAVVATQQTGAGGEFSFKGLNPGVAGLVGYSANGLMIVGMNLAASDAVGVAPVQVHAAVIEGADAAVAMQMIRAGLTDRDVRFSGALSDADAQFKLGTGEPSTTLVTHRVQLQKDGTLHGAISILDERTGRNREVLDMTVYFLRDGEVSGSTKVQNDGKFIVAGLLPGVHSVVATGKDGSLAASVDILGSTYEAAEREEFSPVSIVQSLDFSGSPVGPANLNSGNVDSVFEGDVPGVGEVVTEEVVTTETMNSTGGGGGGFGGGGGGGGGGLGLLGLAGLAGLAGLNNKKDNPASPGI